jgi:hypothetical protein
LIIAHAYFNLTVVVRIVGARWEQLHPGIEQAARTLGASPLTVFRTVTLPLLRGALATASGVIALFALTSYGIVRTLGGPARATIETEIYTRSVLIGDMPGAIALSILQMIVLTALLWWWAKRHRDESMSPQISVAQQSPSTGVWHCTCNCRSRYCSNVRITVALTYPNNTRRYSLYACWMASGCIVNNSFCNIHQHAVCVVCHGDRNSAWTNGGSGSRIRITEIFVA